MKNAKNHNFRNKTGFAHVPEKEHFRSQQRDDSEGDRVQLLMDSNKQGSRFRSYGDVCEVSAPRFLPDGFNIKPFMTSIAEGRVLAVLAVAEPDFLLFCQGEFLGTKACAFVIPVAHGLVAAQSTGAPPMVSGFKFKSDRFGFKDFRKVTHKPHTSRRCPRGQ